MSNLHNIKIAKESNKNFTRKHFVKLSELFFQQIYLKSSALTSEKSSNPKRFGFGLVKYTAENQLWKEHQSRCNKCGGGTYLIWIHIF